MKKFVALLLAVLMVASLCACGQKDTQTGSDIKTVTAGKLTMSTNAQFPPYESVADDGKGYEGTGFEGIDIEIAYALAQKLGLELVVDNMDFDAALSAVQTGKSDMVAAGVTVTPDRLIHALDTDYADDPELLHLLRYEAPKMGCDDDRADRLGTLILDSFADALEGKKNCLGGIWRAGTGTAMYYLWYSRDLGATADGRYAGDAPKGAFKESPLWTPANLFTQTYRVRTSCHRRSVGCDIAEKAYRGV